MSSRSYVRRRRPELTRTPRRAGGRIDRRRSRTLPRGRGPGRATGEEGRRERLSRLRSGFGRRFRRESLSAPRFPWRGRRRVEAGERRPRPRAAARAGVVLHPRDVAISVLRVGPRRHAGRRRSVGRAGEVCRSRLRSPIRDPRRRRGPIGAALALRRRRILWSRGPARLLRRSVPLTRRGRRFAQRPDRLFLRRGGLAPSPVDERGAARERRREAVRGLVREGAGGRRALGKAAVPVIGHAGSEVPIVIEGHERADALLLGAGRAALRHPGDHTGVAGSGTVGRVPRRAAHLANRVRGGSLGADRTRRSDRRPGRGPDQRAATGRRPR